MTRLDSGDGRWLVRPTSLPTLNFKQFNPHLSFSAAGQYSNYGERHHVEIESHRYGAKKSQKMGEIEWHPKTGEILNIQTEEPFRRLGVAETLFHEAKNIARDQGLAEPVHSADRSDMGDTWAKAVGGDLPKRLR